MPNNDKLNRILFLIEHSYSKMSFADKKNLISTMFNEKECDELVADYFKKHSPPKTLSKSKIPSTPTKKGAKKVSSSSDDSEEEESPEESSEDSEKESNEKDDEEKDDSSENEDESSEEEEEEEEEDD